MKYLRGAGGGLITFVGYILQIVVNASGYITINGKVIYALTAAINVGDAIPLTGAPAGSLAITTHATGRGQIFVSDGANWLDYYAVNVHVIVTTVPTAAGNTDIYAIAPATGKLLSAIISFTDALIASDSNFVTFSLTNLGQAGAGTAVMLAATAANTNKATGGSALVAHTKRLLALTGVAADLATVIGDRLRFRIAGAGTLPNTLTGGVLVLVYQRTV